MLSKGVQLCSCHDAKQDEVNQDGPLGNDPDFMGD
jgi:hypothetical protein